MAFRKYFLIYVFLLLNSSAAERSLAITCERPPSTRHPVIWEGWRAFLLCGPLQIDRSR